jgi:ectoine hydroxylase
LLGAHPRVIEPVEQIFCEKVYMHQYKINTKSAFDNVQNLSHFRN